MPRHLRRRIETLIPVKLRLLDESGRHRIAEPMLGIATEVSGSDLRVSVMGRSGRPLSLRLAEQQKMVVSFLATELHEKVESLVCDLQSVVPISGQPDAWEIRLVLPVLMPDLAEDIVSALQRYGRQRRRAVGLWPVAGLVVGAAFLTWTLSAWSGARSVKLERWQNQRLRAQLDFSNQTIDQLTKQLEDADQELERQLGAMAASDDARSTVAALEAQNAALVRQLERVEAKRPEDTEPAAKVQLRGVSLTDFRTVRSIRGAATAPRLAYRDGTLELFASKPEHRQIARNAGRLLTAFAQERQLPLKYRASWSLESADGAVGVETEAAFFLDEAAKGQPDFVFETRDPNTGSWLANYATVGIQEVWLWRRGELEIRRLSDSDYVVAPQSSLLPDLEPAVLGRYISRDDQTAAIREFTQNLDPTATGQ